MVKMTEFFNEVLFLNHKRRFCSMFCFFRVFQQIINRLLRNDLSELQNYTKQLFGYKISHPYAISKSSDKTGLSDHFEPIYHCQKPTELPLQSFEVRTNVIFSQSGDDSQYLLFLTYMKGQIKFYKLKNFEPI